jgi:hypothetical protein
MGTAETAARSAARGRGSARPTRGMGRPGMRRTAPATGGTGFRLGRSRPAPAAGGIAGMVEGFLRRR